MTEVVHVQPAPQTEVKWESFGVVNGLSESDFMSRQRYLENSGLKGVRSQAGSIASRLTEPNLSSSANIHNFIQEQRKIISGFRSQPWSMQLKAAALKSYSNNVSKYANQMNPLDTFRDNSKQLCRRLCRWWRSLVQHVTLWNSIIKQIEGRFGSSVASFFTFLRWLCALNLLVTALVLGVVVVPQGIGGHGLEVPAAVKENGSAFSFFFDGKGYVFEYSVLFYGYYDSGQNEPYLPPPHNPNPHIMLNYKLPLAYLLVSVSVFAVCIMAILFNMAEKYKLLQRANVSEQYLFAWKVFGSWDHAITNADTAANKQRHIAISLKETIMEAQKHEDSGIKWRFLLLRVLSSLAVLILLVGSSYAIFVAVEKAEEASLKSTSIQSAIEQGWMGIWLLLQSFQVQAVVIVRNMLLPYVFFIAERLEHYHPRTALKMLLVRLFLLYITSLYMLIIALLTLSSQCLSSDGNTTNATLWSAIQFRRSVNGTNNLNNNMTTQNLRAEGSNGRDICCWETVIGQELYKLTITYFAAELVSIAIADALRWALVQSRFCPRLSKLLGPAEFRLAENILKLVYGQALVWLGVLFCPLLPAINLVKCVLLFYIRAVVVAIFNRPPSIMFRVASTRNFYMGLLLLMVFLCIFPVGFAIIQMGPSKTCGPFRGLPSMLAVLSNEVRTWPSLVQKVFMYLQTPTVIIPLICTICIVVYYYATLASALKEVNKDLRLQLHMEQKETRERIAKDAQPNPLTDQQQVLQRQIPTYEIQNEQQDQWQREEDKMPPSPHRHHSPHLHHHPHPQRQLGDDQEWEGLPYSPHSMETDWASASVRHQSPAGHPHHSVRQTTL